jgi:hypothetical protein
MDMPWAGTRCVAFANARRCLATGELRQVALKVKEVLDADPLAQVLVFDEATSKLIDLDLRGSAAEIGSRLAQTTADEALEAEPDSSGQASSRGRGRPKLGVVAREVTLLPRHWDWLNAQPGGASVALRKLVEEARRDNEGTDRIRQSQEAGYRFMSAIAGDKAQFEEATRALFAGDRERFTGLIAKWPGDVRDHLHKLAVGAFPQPSAVRRT